MDNSYLAGFFDGEGSVSLIRVGKSKSFQVVVAITNTDLTILERIKEVFGGDIFKGKRIKSNHKERHVWRVSSKAAYTFLLEIYPYSLMKQERIKLALKFQQRIINRNGLKDRVHLTEEEHLLRLDYNKKMTLLNKKGIITA